MISCGGGGWPESFLQPAAEKQPLLCAACPAHFARWPLSVRWQPPLTKRPTSLPANSWWRKPSSEGPAWSSCLRALTTLVPAERRRWRCQRAWQETRSQDTLSWPGKHTAFSLFYPAPTMKRTGEIKFSLTAEVQCWYNQLVKAKCALGFIVCMNWSQLETCG